MDKDNGLYCKCAICKTPLPDGLSGLCWDCEDSIPEGENL